MKKIIIIILPILAITLLLTAFWTQKPTTSEIPALLDRPEKLGSVEEQNFIRQKYFELKNEIEVRSENQQALVDLAQLYMFEARITGEHGHYYPAALAIIEPVAEKPKNKDLEFQALLTQASVYLSLHEFEKALVVAKKGRELNPYNALVHGALVDAYVELGDYEKAVEMADAMVAIRPDLRSYSRISYLREIHGEVAGAIEAMKLAVSAALPGTEEAAWCQLILGRLYAKYGQPDMAETTFKTILAQRPNYPFALAELGKLAAEKEDFATAEKYYKSACDIIPEVGFYEELAHLYQKQGEQEKVEKLTSEILEMLADDEANGHKMTLEYAHVYRDLIQDYDKALTYAKTAQEERPDNIDVNLTLASIYHASQQPENAKIHLAIAKRTSSKYPELIELESQLFTK
jgi:tetratricopeptide (TPR) repeat protein